MSSSDRAENGENESGTEQPRFAFHDRRRIDPQTGEVRVSEPADATSEKQAAPSENSADTAAAGPDAVIEAEETVDSAADQPVFPTEDDVADLTAAAEAAAASPPSGAADPVQAEWEDLTRQLADRTADLKRLNAEYANYRKRVDRDREAVAVAGRSQLAAELLVVLDDLERAEAHGDLTGAFRSVADKLVGALTKSGLEPYGEANEPFDPTAHEAVQHDTSPDVSGPTVTMVLRRGYRFGDRILRPALVAVTDYEAAAPASSAAAADETPSSDQQAGSSTDAVGESAAKED
ncbi:MULTISPECIES: nucleotide exchange factor GrpE [Actinoalloteichus]|uniref:Protein GrpE n=1 Tax=Actinoalloteichus fjordicus TaxID=1612552 RepID=A0AAC9PV61_9PSEU|nr:MULTISPECIES: nucleotide exchange factor GrpE [Actinoalloteichus]APU17933.1 molecular chaperone GrpE (heat shock protein) [Actinoalloteichus fjordicus]APU24012.1 molecular chaperone GrpE (heat shock protein) [Actinoalloteichus sp. GBA129-24]